MKAQSPADSVAQFVGAMNRGDLDAALKLYEPGASLVVEPGRVATGLPALREALAQFLVLRPTLTTEKHHIVEAGDVALYCAQWSLSGRDPGGNPVQLSGRAADVLRRQPDGNWLIAVDNPWGGEIVAGPVR
jgi:ketosteroid isomerase-like protein